MQNTQILKFSLLVITNLLLKGRQDIFTSWILWHWFAFLSLQALVKHVQSKGYPNERFELLTNFPRRKLSHLDYEITLQEAGLCPQETVFVQERN